MSSKARESVLSRRLRLLEQTRKALWDFALVLGQLRGYTPKTPAEPAPTFPYVETWGAHGLGEGESKWLQCPPTTN